ncbi:MAG: O-antigen ligase family protein [Candidatus Rokubacteria bacterium]|nr:O-antigen ligase family protein [Candidatus Rokubacteria bacterium]
MTRVTLALQEAAWPAAPAVERIGLFLFVILLPVMVVSGLPLLGRKLQPADLAFLVAAVAVGLRLVRERVWPQTNGLGLAFAAFLVVEVGATALSSDPARSAMVLAGSIYLVLVAVLVITAVRSTEVLRRLLDVWLATTAAVAALGLAGVALGYVMGIRTPLARLAGDHWVFGRTWQLLSTFQSPPIPNLAYSYLQVGVFLGLGMLAGEAAPRRRRAIAAAVALALLAIAFTQSRGVAPMLLGLAVFLRSRPGRGAALARGSALAIGLALFVAVQLITYLQVDAASIRWGDSGKRVEEQIRPDRPWYMSGPLVFIQPGTPYREVQLTLRYLPEHRVFLREAVLEMVRQHPLLGVGPGQFGQELVALWRAGRLDPVYRLFSPRYPHSVYLGFLAERGVLGLGAVLLLLVLAVRAAAAARKAADPWVAGLGWGALGCVVAFVIYGVDADILNFRWVWVLIGFTAVLGRLARTVPRQAAT